MEHYWSGWEVKTEIRAWKKAGSNHLAGLLDLAQPELGLEI
jgi:hypothetical protein